MKRWGYSAIAVQHTPWFYSLFKFMWIAPPHLRILWQVWENPIGILTTFAYLVLHTLKIIDLLYHQTPLQWCNFLNHRNSGQLVKLISDINAPYNRAFRNHDSLLILCSLVVHVNTTVTSSLIMINATSPRGPNRNSTRRLKQLQQLQTSVDAESIAWLITTAVADEVVNTGKFQFSNSTHYAENNWSGCLHLQYTELYMLTPCVFTLSWIF